MHCSIIDSTVFIWRLFITFGGGLGGEGCGRGRLDWVLTSPTAVDYESCSQDYEKTRETDQ
uniref:Uncharacterized protein n=1 Tax=Anguilla anguilla TaxID=7936 RepID=A0A0E9P6K4_ANGAN